MDIREVATWLANIDSNGCSDVEFAEVFVLMRKIWETRNPDYNLTKKDMEECDVENLTGWIASCLDEILFSDEIDRSAWWKENY